MVGVSDSVTIKLTSYLSAQHFEGALFHAQQARVYEEAQSDSADPRLIFIATSAVFCSVAFMEAVINEFYSDALADGNPPLQIASLPPTQQKLLAAIAPLVDRQSTFDKYQIALKTLGLPKISPGSAIWDNASALVALRNHLVHFSPETHVVVDSDPSNLSEGKIRKRVKGKFQGNPYFQTGTITAFESEYLSAGCADWAAKSVKDFTDEFYRILGIDPPYKSRLENT